MNGSGMLRRTFGMSYALTRRESNLRVAQPKILKPDGSTPPETYDGLF